MQSGEKERVKVLAVCGNIVVARTSSGHIKFIDCDCICAVIVDCDDISDGIFPSPPDRKI